MNKEQIAKFFAKRPGCKAFWLVNDSLIFLNEERANEQGGKIEKIYRDAQSVGKHTPTVPTAEEVEAAKAELSALELDEKTDYNVLKRLVGVLGIETNGNKKADYLAAVETFKNEGNEEVH